MAPLLLKLQQLSIDNMVMWERERMLGLVRRNRRTNIAWTAPRTAPMPEMHWFLVSQLLEVRERQEQRQRDIKTGLAGNPLAPLGMTVADAQSTLLGVLKLPVKLVGLAARWSKALDRLKPLLLKYPQLRDPAPAPTPSRPVDERLQCPVINAIMLSVKPENDEERRQMAELGVLLRDGHDVVVAMLYGYLMRPALISLSHVNVQALCH
jgi:hypothetical protein